MTFYKNTKSDLSLFQKFRLMFQKKKLEKTYSQRFFSQEGEDMVLAYHLGNRTSGFYVDIGAHHPFRFSNTYHFYLKGWRGINIDARPGSMELFNLFRPRDINLEIAISNVKSSLKYHMFDEPALNSFDDKLSSERDKTTSYNLIKTIDIVTRLLGDVLDEYVDKNLSIDFMTIDVEGLDFKVLNSNNWDRYKPEYVLVEDLEHNSKLVNSNSELVTFMYSKGYSPVSKTINTLFFRRNA